MWHDSKCGAIAYDVTSCFEFAPVTSYVIIAMQMVERQQNVVAALEETHVEKGALAKKNHEILRRNLLFTLDAERKKVS